MARTQATGSEVLDDSLTGDDIQEETLVDSKIPFVEPEFSALNVHDAIVESRTTTRFFGVLDRDVEVPQDFGMIMINPIIGANEIKIHGELRIL